MGAVLSKEFCPTTREQTSDFWFFFFFLYLDHSWSIISQYVVWGKESFGLTKQLSPAIAFPATCMHEREQEIIHQFIISANLLLPLAPSKSQSTKKSGRGEGEMKQCLWYLPEGFFIDVSWSCESWMGSELCYQNLHHWMRQRENSLALEAGRQGPCCSFISLTRCFLSRTQFLNRPTAYSFCAQRRKHTECLLDNTLSYVNNCPQHLKAR